MNNQWDNGSGYMELDAPPLLPQDGKEWMGEGGSKYVFSVALNNWVTEKEFRYSRLCNCNSGYSWIQCQEHTSYCG